jgi:hypothetical protein
VRCGRPFGSLVRLMKRRWGASARCHSATRIMIFCCNCSLYSLPIGTSLSWFWGERQERADHHVVVQVRCVASIGSSSTNEDGGVSSLRLCLLPLCLPLYKYGTKSRYTYIWRSISISIHRVCIFTTYK